MRLLTIFAVAATLAFGAAAQAQPAPEIQAEGLFLPESVLAPQGVFLAERGALRSRAVRLDARQLAGASRPGAPLTLNLFDNATFEAVVERVRPTRGAGYVITARLPGTDRGEMMLAVNGRAVSGMVDTPQGSFTIRSDGFGRLTVREVDPSAVPELATPLSPEAEVPLSPATAEIPAVSLPQGMSTPSGPGQPGSSPLALTGPSADIGVDDG